MKETGDKWAGLLLPARWCEQLEPLRMLGGKSLGYLVRLMFPDRFRSTKGVWVYDPGAESDDQEVNK